MKYILSMALILFYSAAHAQQPEKKELSLREALDLARTKNYDIRESLAEVGIAKGQLNSANAAFLPQVELSENYVNTNDPLNVFGLKLKQGTVASSDFNPELLNEPDAIDNFNTRIEVRQPILNIDAFAQKSALKSFYEAAQLGHHRKLQYISYVTKQSYYSLLLAKLNISAAEKSVRTAQEGFELAQDNLEAGYILQSDLLAAEVRLLTAKNQLNAAQAAYFNASQQFKYLLGISPDAELELTDSLAIPVTAVLLEDSLQIKESRSDIEALERMREGRKKQLNAHKFQYLPNLNMMFSYEWNDDVAFGNQADNYLAGISLRWKLFDGYRREAEIQRTKSQWEKSEITREKHIAQANIELSNTLKQLEISYEQIAIHKLAVDRAERLYQIKRDRYKVGLEKTVDLIDAETDVFRQRTALQNSLYSYYNSIFTIEYLIEQEII